MKISEKRKQYTKDYNQENYARFQLVARKEDGQRIRAAAAAAGKSVNAFVLGCVYDVIGQPEREPEKD